MKLPDIEYAPVQTTSQDLRLDDAQRRAAQVFSEGLTRYGMELVKTETQAASAELAAGLAEIESDLMSKRYVSTQELRDAGVLDSLPPEIRERTTTRGLDVATGQSIDLDRDDIPVWEVASAIYDRRAKQLLDQASQKVGAKGWRSEFVAASQDEVLSRKMRVTSQQMQAMHADLHARQKSHVETLTRAGAFDQAAAAIASSGIFTPAEKEQLVDQVERERQVQPLNDRALAGVQSARDVLEVGKLVGRLESGEGLDRLEDKERIQWKHHLEALVRGFEAEGKEAAAGRFRDADEQAWNMVLGAYREAGGRPLSMRLVPPPGQISASAQKALIGFVESTRPGAKPVETDLSLYAELTRMATTDPAGFKTYDLVQHVGRLSVPHFTHFADLQRTLKAGNDVAYQGFVGAQEETNRHLLAAGFKVSGKDAEDDALAVGHVHSVVNTALFRETMRLRRELSLDERDPLIAKVVAQEVKRKGWFGRGGAQSLGVDPTYVTPLRAAASALGRGQDGESLKKLHAEYSATEPLLEDAWRKRSPRPLRPDQAVAVWTVMRRDQAQIDAALQRAGRTPDDTLRAIAAVDAVLGGIR